MKKCVILLSLITVLGCSHVNVLYVKNINIIDVNTGNVSAKQFIEIRNDKIIRYDTMNKFPKGNFNTYEGNNRYAFPGLADMHVHFGDRTTDADYWNIHPGDRLISNGITTVRDCGFFGNLKNYRKDNSKILGFNTIGPNIITCTIANYFSGKSINNIAGNYERECPDYIKIKSYIPFEQLSNIAKFANENNIYLYGHINSFQDLIRLNNANFNEIAHVSILYYLLLDVDAEFEVNWNDEEDVQEKVIGYYKPYFNLTEDELQDIFSRPLDTIMFFLKEHNISVTTTMFLEKLWTVKIHDFDKYLQYAEQNEIPKIYTDNFKKHVAYDSEKLEKFTDFYDFQYKFDKMILKELYRRKIRIIAGTDITSECYFGMDPGTSLLNEIYVLKECGFSNLDALKTCTVNSSNIGYEIGLNFKFGEIKPGYIADLIICDENPVLNLRTLENLDAVIKSGILYDKQEINLYRKKYNL